MLAAKSRRTGELPLEDWTKVDIDATWPRGLALNHHALCLGDTLRPCPQDLSRGRCQAFNSRAPCPRAFLHGGSMQAKLPFLPPQRLPPRLNSLHQYHETF